MVQSLLLGWCMVWGVGYLNLVYAFSKEWKLWCIHFRPQDWGPGCVSFTSKPHQTGAPTEGREPHEPQAATSTWQKPTAGHNASPLPLPFITLPAPHLASTETKFPRLPTHSRPPTLIRIPTCGSHWVPRSEARLGAVSVLHMLAAVSASATTPRNNEVAGSRARSWTPPPLQQLIRAPQRQDNQILSCLYGSQSNPCINLGIDHVRWAGMGRRVSCGGSCVWYFTGDKFWTPFDSYCGLSIVKEGDTFCSEIFESLELSLSLFSYMPVSFKVKDCIAWKERKFHQKSIKASGGSDMLK